MRHPLSTPADHTPRDRVEQDTALAFQAAFGRRPRVLSSAPGRVNLIGEHTDYNDGFVFPAAIDRFVAAAAAGRSDDLLVVHSVTLGSTVTAPLNDLIPRAGGSWANYVIGVAAKLLAAGVPLRGTDLCIAGNVPSGSGLSSSAALELAAAYALRGLSGAAIQDMDLVRYCQQAEHEFAGVRCGIMDQYIAVFGRDGHALKIDCRSLTSEAVPIPGGLLLVVLHTGIGRGLGASEYNIRRAQCAEAVTGLAAALPGLRSLRDVAPEDLERHSSLLDPVLLHRARHVVTENRRVIRAADALKNNRLDELGKLMYDSHVSLRIDYQVSCAELDVMVDICARCDGVIGARMTGAGFGGAAICLAREDAVPGLIAHVDREYPERTGKEPLAFVCSAVAGARAAALDPLA